MRAKYLYMGVNWEASNYLLPSTRVIEKAKDSWKRRSSRPRPGTSGSEPADSRTPRRGLLHRLIRASRVGLGLFALRMDQDAAESLGLNTTLYKNIAHCLSAFLVGVAGGLYVVYLSYVHPDTVFSFDLSIGMVLMGVIGGVGTLWGPVLGATIYLPIQQLLLAQPSLVAIHQLIFGGLLIAIILFEPGGLLGLIRRVARR